MIHYLRCLEVVQAKTSRPYGAFLGGVLKRDHSMTTLALRRNLNLPFSQFFSTTTTPLQVTRTQFNRDLKNDVSFHPNHQLRSLDEMIYEGRTQDMLQLYQEFKAAGRTTDYKFAAVFVKMITMCSKFKLKEIGKQLFQDSIDAGFGSNPKILTSGIQFFGKTGQVKRAIELYELVTEHHAATFTVMMTMCAKHRLKKLGQEVYQKAIDCGFGNDKRMLTSSITFFGRVGMLKEAKQCFESALKLGEEIMLYNSWLQCLTKANEIDEAIKFFKSMEYCDGQTYSIVLSMCSKYNLKELEQEVSQRANEFLERRPITENTNLFSSLKKSIFQGNTQESIKLYRELKQMGVMKRTAHFNLELIFVGMLSLCSKSNNLKEMGNEVFQDAMDAGLGLNTKILTAGIQFFGNTGQIDRVIELHQSVDVYDEFTCTVMMSVCYRHQLKELGQEVFKKAVNSGLGKNPRFVNSSMGFFSRIGMFNEARQCFDTAVELGADAITNTSWLNCLINANKIEEAIEFYRMMKCWNDITCCLLLQMCTKHQLKELGQEIHQRGLQEFGNNKHILNASVKFFGSVGMLNEAQQCFDLAVKVGAGVMVYNTWLWHLINNLNKIDEAIEFFKAMKEYDEITFYTMLGLCSKHKLKELGKEINDKAVALGYKISQTYNKRTYQHYNNNIDLVTK